MTLQTLKDAVAPEIDDKRGLRFPRWTLRVPGQEPVSLSIFDITKFAIIGIVVARHYQERAKGRGAPAVFNQMRKQGLPQDWTRAVLGYHEKINAKDVS